MYELAMSEVTPTLFRESLLENGVLLIRGAIDASVLEPLTSEVYNMIDYYSAISPEIIAREMQNECIERRGFWHEILNDGVHYNADFIIHTQGRYSLFDPYFRSGLQPLTQAAWPGMNIRPNYVTNVRRIYATGASGYSDSPLSLHIDAMFHQHDAFAINFWTPLTAAGRNQPGLQIIPASVESIKEYLEYNPQGYTRREGDFANMHHFRLEKLQPEALARTGLYVRSYYPELQPGDVLTFTNYTLHATAVRPEMTGSRTSIEVRMLLESAQEHFDMQARLYWRSLGDFSRRLAGAATDVAASAKGVRSRLRGALSARYRSLLQSLQGLGKG